MVLNLVTPSRGALEADARRPRSKEGQEGLEGLANAYIDWVRRRAVDLPSSADDRKKAAEERVRETMLGIYGAFEDLDAQALDENFSHSDDLLAFGTDRDEKFAGWKRYKDVHAVQFQALRSFRFESRELEVHVDGNVAWAADRPRWRIETKVGEKVKTEVRITAVLHRDPAARRWLVVQWHVSEGLRERLHEY